MLIQQRVGWKTDFDIRFMRQGFLTLMAQQIEINTIKDVQITKKSPVKKRLRKTNTLWLIQLSIYRYSLKQVILEENKVVMIV